MCAGIQVTPQCPDQTVSPRHLSERWPGRRHRHGPLHGCAPQLPTLRSVLSPMRDYDIQGHGQDGAILPSALILVADSKKSSSQGKFLPLSSRLPFPRGTDMALHYPSSAFSSRNNGGNLNCLGFWGAVSPPCSECGQGPDTTESNTDVSRPCSTVVPPYGLEVIWVHHREHILGHTGKRP